MGPITAPGIYENVPAAEYHADPCATPSLSRSVAKTIVERTPGHARHEHPRLNPGHEEKTAPAFSMGTACHSLILGGRRIVEIDAPDYRTNDAKSKRDEAFHMGLTPMLAHQLADAQAAVASIRAQLPGFGLGHIFDDSTGVSEAVGVWSDPVGGWCRMLIDRLAKDLTVYDLKFTELEINPENLGRHCSSMGYEFQQAFYERGLANLFPELKGRVQFVFIFAEVKAPHAVMPVRLPRDALAKGRHNVALAMDRWRDAMATDQWPMFSGPVVPLEYPPWAVAEFSTYADGGEA